MAKIGSEQIEVKKFLDSKRASLFEQSLSGGWQLTDRLEFRFFEEMVSTDIGFALPPQIEIE